MTTAFRRLFDIPREVCYLNAAYMTPQPVRVIEAGMRGVRQRADAWKVEQQDFFESVEALRTAFACLIGASSDNISLVPSASYGVSTAAHNLQFDEGDAILVLAEQFPANVYPWRRLAERRHGQVVTVAPGADRDWTSAVLEALAANPRFRIVALPNHHWATAEHVDLLRIAPAVRDAGAALVVDLTQTLGAAAFDLAAVDPDYVAVAGYKWLFCPYGVSFLYVADRNCNGLPLDEAWATRRGSEDFAGLVDYVDDYAPGARRYDIGQRASFANVAGALEALQLILDIGPAIIADDVARTCARIAALLEARGFDVPASEARAPHFLTASHPAADTASVHAALGRRGVYISRRGRNLRIAPHIYNDEADLRLFERQLDNTQLID